MSEENVEFVRHVYESGLFDRDPGEETNAGYAVERIPRRRIT